jgi:4-amino-4-deoxy-L-arabinose transferase-like glycosyltransferase
MIERLAAGARAYALIALIALAAALPGVFAMPPLDRDESRFAQATAQMLETSDFVRISFQDDPRNKKPVGIHWLQAGAVSLVSSAEAREIWAYRLVSVLGAIIAALATFWAGLALLPRPAAFAGAALFAAGILISTEGMIAKTDAMLCGLTTLALAALAHLRMRREEENGRLLALVFWAALAGGVLIKGPITPMVAGLTLIALGLYERRWAWMRPLTFWAGPLLAAAIAAPWLIAIGIATDGAFFAEALGGDLTPKLAGGGEHPFAPPGVHTLLTPILIFPATLALLPGLAAAFAALRRREVREAASHWTFLLAWLVPSFLVFEAMPTKLVHYPLPTYPALALIAGAGLLAAFAGAGKLSWRALALFAAGGAAHVALAAFLATQSAGGGTQTAILVGAIGAGALVLALVMLSRARTAGTALLVAIAAGLVSVAALRQGLAPRADALLVSREASAALAEAGLHPRLSPDARGPLLVVGYSEPSLVFLTRTDTILAQPEPAAARAFAGQPALVAESQRPALDAALAARGLRFAPAGAAAAGRNYSKNRPVALQPGQIVSLSLSSSP